MVKVFSDADKKTLGLAIAEAESKTSAELVLVVAPASDAYQSYMTIYGLLLGSALATWLWATKIVVAFPYLLAIQLLAISLLAFIPWVRHRCLRLIPKHILHRRAAHRAYEEYLVLSRHVSAVTPIVLLYISAAEHYAHILTSRLVREKIPDESWNAVITELTAAIPKGGLRDASIGTIQRISELLGPHFPDNGGANALEHDVIEIKS
jgi:putative membrane protein